MLKPVVWFCLRRSLGLQDLMEAAKVVFIKAAAEEMEAQGKKVNISALSVLTGMHRKGIVKIYRDRETSDHSTKFASRVIGQWRHDPDFLTKNGRPRVLSYGGPDSEFADLVGRVSTDLYQKGILYDLERIGAVVRTSRGVKLLTSAYRPKHDPVEGFRLMARDAEHLLTAIEENVFSEKRELPHFHGTVIYDNISVEDFSKIRKWLFAQSLRFQKKVDNFLSRYDLDIHPQEKSEGGKTVVLGIFSRM